MRICSIFRPTYGLVTLVAVAAIIPFFINPYYIHILIYGLWFIYLSIGWNILASAGQENTGYPVFIGAGAYTSTMLYLKLDLSPWIGMFGGLLVAIILALAIGFLCFPRALPLMAFALITLAFTFIAWYSVSGLLFLGGNEGLNMRFMETNVANFQFVSKIPYFHIMLGMTIGAIFLHRLILRSKVGYYFKAIRDNPRAAAAVGVDLVRYKFLGLIIHALLGALGGTVWAQYAAYIDPQSMLSPHLGVIIILMALIGGRGTLWGPVVAAGLLVPFGEWLRGALGGQYPGVNLIIYGLIVVVIILRMPAGIWGWVEEHQRGRRLRALAANPIQPMPKA